MKLVNRLILLIITLVFMFSTIILAIYSFGWTELDSLIILLRSIYSNWQTGIIFLLAFAAGAWVIYPFFTYKDGKQTTRIAGTELGEVDISLKALENLVQGVAYQQEEIEEIKTDLKNTEQGLKIMLTGKVHQGTVVPELTDQLQKLVKSYIEDTTGVNVNQVQVLIEDIYKEENPRVE